MITLNMSQFKALFSKELKEAFRDKRAILSDMSAMMIFPSTNSVKCLIAGVAA